MSAGKDIRQWDPRPNPAAIAEAIGLFARSREIDLRLSLVLAEIEALGAHRVEGSATIAEFARRNGFDGWRAAELARLGRAVEKAPELQPKLESGELTIAAAAAVAPLLVKPELQKPGEDWVRKAEETPLRELRRDVKFRVEEVRQGSPVTLRLELAVSEETCGKFRRTRDLASQIVKKELSESETFAWMANHCVECLDPLTRERRKRRMGPTAEYPERRGVPTDATVEIARRSDLRCEVPGCTRVATEQAHVRPHAFGSGREARDLWDACPTHHTMYDKTKILRIAGWTRDGKPIFVFADGRPVRARPQSSRRSPTAPGPRRAKRTSDDSTEDRATRAPEK